MTEVVSALDASFLEFETPSAHMHVIGVTVLDPATAIDGFGFATVRRVIETRLLPLERFRQRVHSPLLGLGSPLWQTDPRFDLDWHLRHIALPAPGGAAELETLVGDIASRPLGRDRPLWEMWVVEGLEHGRWALISKIHHTVVDGLSGAAVLAHLLDLEPRPKAASPPMVVAMSEPDLLARVRAVGPRLLQELMASTPTPVFRGAMRLYERLAATNRVAPFANLIISNVPGPTMPLYLGGALVIAVHPLGPILDGTPLNLSVMSQQDRLDIGAIACRETVADLGAITTGFARAVEELRRVATGRPPAPSRRIASA